MSKNNSENSKKSFFKRYQKVIEIVCFSLVSIILLSLFYTYFIAEKKQGKTNSTDESSYLEVEQRLQEIISQIKGVGAVDVLISYADEGKLIIAYETITDSNGNVTTTPVFSSGEVVVLSNQKPTIQGVIIVAEGAGSITVKNDILNAVSVGLCIQRDIIQIYEKS